MIIIQKNLEFYSNFLPAVNDQTGNYYTKYVEIIVPLKYFSNFWRGLKMHLINCEITANHSYGGY